MDERIEGEISGKIARNQPFTIEIANFQLNYMDFWAFYKEFMIF